MFAFACVCCVCLHLVRVCVVLAVVVSALCVLFDVLEKQNVVIEQTHRVCVYIVISSSVRL